MDDETAGMEIGGKVAFNRSLAMPCICDRQDGGELTDHKTEGGRCIERVRCRDVVCGRTWTRIWTHGVR